MKRRLLLTMAGAVALGSAARASPAPGGYAVSADQLQRAVAQRFPLRYPMGGLMDLNVQAPVLRLLPALNRLGTTMAVQASGLALGRSYTGAFDLDFGLRYEASDQTVRAHQLRVNSLRFADLPPGPSALLEAYGPALAEQTLREVVLHRLHPQDLALPDGLGLQPDSITVTPQGLLIGFVAKPLR